MSMSLFSCPPQEVKKRCAFQGIGPCREQISHLICNAHAELFGLTYATASYVNGNNDTWTKINTYVSATNNLHIPLFMDAENRILSKDIRTFAINVANTYSFVRVDEFQARIACYMGVNLYAGNEHCIRSWFDEPSSGIILRRNNAEILYFRELPPLHKILFYYTQPSYIRNTSTDTRIYTVPNLSLTYNETTNSFAFVVPNKSILLKKTDRQDCVATPVIIDAVREIAQDTKDRIIQPIINNMITC